MMHPEIEKFIANKNTCLPRAGWRIAASRPWRNYGSAVAMSD